MLETLKTKTKANSNKHIFMIETIFQNFEGHTKQEVEQAISARQSQEMLGNPVKKTSKELYVKSGWL